MRELERELRDRATARRLRAIANAREGYERLRIVAGDPGELMRHVPEQVCRSFRLGRCVVARVDGGDWVLTHAHFDDDPAAAKAYCERLRCDRVSLRRSHLESAMIRRRAAVLLDTPDGSIVGARDAPAPFDAHVVCPVVLRERVVAFIYAGDRNHGVDQLDRDAVAWFADGVAQLFELAVLTRRLHGQREHVCRMASAASTVMGEFCEADIELHVGGEADGDPAGAWTAMLAGPERRLASLLTRRELSVLELMAEGLRNAAIGERLVITEGTVKSHVKHILRKLRATNRAEAVALYLHQHLGDRP